MAKWLVTDRTRYPTSRDPDSLCPVCLFPARSFPVRRTAPGTEAEATGTQTEENRAGNTGQTRQPSSAACHCLPSAVHHKHIINQLIHK